MKIHTIPLLLALFLLCGFTTCHRAVVSVAPAAPMGSARVESVSAAQGSKAAALGLGGGDAWVALTRKGSINTPSLKLTNAQVDDLFREADALL